MKPFQTLALLVGLAVGATCAAGPSTQWMALNREDGCVPLAELQADRPELAHAHDPQALFKALKRRHPDTKIQPFATYLRQAPDGTPGPGEQLMRQAITPRNAFIIRSDAQQLELIVFTQQLCKRLMTGQSG